MEKALEIDEKVKSHILKSKALRLLAEANQRGKRYGEALDYFQRFLEEGKQLHHESLQKVRYQAQVQQEVHGYLLEVESLKRHSQELEQANRILEELNCKLVEADREKQFLIRSLGEHNRRLSCMITEDRQSGLYNLGAFREKLRHEMARSQRYRRPLTLTIFDLEHCEERAAELPGDRIDQLIDALARIIKENIRSVDLAGHYNHRQFVIAFPEIGHRKADSDCQRIQRYVAHYDWRQIQTGLEVTIDYGLVEYRPGLSLEDLFREAEEKTGRGRARFQA